MREKKYRTGKGGRRHVTGRKAWDDLSEEEGRDGPSVRVEKKKSHWQR